MNPELVKQAILKEEKSFIQEKVNKADLDDYFSFKNIINNSLVGPGNLLSFSTLGLLLLSAETFLLPFILPPITLSFLSVLGVVFSIITIPFFFAFFIGCQSLKRFYKRKLSRFNDEEKFSLYKRMYGNLFYHQEVNTNIKSLLKLSLDNEEYYQLASANDHIDYIHALNAINEKIKKEDILSEKMEVSLDLNKMKEYSIEIVNS